MSAAVSVEPQERLIPIGQIHPSKTNPRRNFAKLEELAEDIRQHGILQPILVRPHEKSGFEIIFGERRYRAAKIAKLDIVPCRVKDYPDNEVLELQLVENVQREDIHPLEEAEGYHRLQQEHGYSAEQIADKVGKTKAWVYSRLKLNALCGAAREAFLEGRLAASIAVYIARIPSPALQEKALHAVAPKHGDPLDARAALALIQTEFTLRLRDAQFNTSDPDLVPEAKGCNTCPKRTGNQRELFPENKHHDTCTDPACFQRKQLAHHKQLVVLWKSKKLPVLTAAECRDLFGTHSTHINSGKGYIDLDDSCFHVPFDAKGNQRKYRDLLPSDYGPVVLAVDGRAFSHELVEEGTALRRALEPFMPKRSERPTTDPKARAKQKARKRATEELVRRILERKTSLETFRLAAHTLYDGLSLEACEANFPVGGVEKAIESLKSVGELWRLIVAIAAENAGEKAWESFVKRYHVDLPRYEREEIALIRGSAS